MKSTKRLDHGVFTTVPTQDSHVDDTTAKFLFIKTDETQKKIGSWRVYYCRHT